jgi:hypothetical protein
MKALNFIYFFIGIIVVISVANAQTFCSFTDNRTTYLSTAMSYNYILRISYTTMVSSSVPNSFKLFELLNTTYFPTYVYISCSPQAESFIRHTYYTPSSSGSCSVSNTIYEGFGITGSVKRTDTNAYIGNWVWYIWPTNYNELYITYTDYPQTKTLAFEKVNAFPITAYYCSVGSVNEYGSLYTIYSSVPQLISNFNYYYTNANTQLTTAVNILAAYTRAATSGTNYTCSFYMRYLIIYDINNLKIDYIKDSKLFNVSFISSFDGYIKILGNKELKFTFSKNTFFNAFIPYINNTFYIYDTNDNLVMSYNLKQYLDCLDEPDTGIYVVKLKDQAGNQILKFKIIYQGNEYISDDKGIITVPQLTNANITVLPLFRPDLAFNTTITTNQPENWITANLYVYTVQLVTRQVTVLGTELPTAFKFIINGQEYKDKVNMSNDNFTFENTAYDNYTVQLLPGNYEIQFRTVLYFPSMTVKVNTYNLSLFDNNYYRKLIWRVGILTDSFNETLLGNPLLSITVINQNGKPVNSAEIQLFDESNNTVGIKSTDNNGNAQFYVRNGYNYTVKVFYAGNLKSVQNVYYPADETVIQLTIQISITQQEQQAVQSGQTTNQTGISTNLTQQEVQNQVTNVLSVILTNYAVWAFVFIIIFASYAARIGGTEIGILVAVICIAVFTFIVPWLPVQIVALIGVVAGIMFGLRLVRRSL